MQEVGNVVSQPVKKTVVESESVLRGLLPWHCWVTPWFGSHRRFVITVAWV